MVLFDYTVKNMLMYGAEIWVWTEVQKIEIYKMLVGIRGNDTNIHSTGTNKKKQIKNRSRKKGR